MKPKRTSLFAQMIRRSALSQTILVSLCVAPAVQAQSLYWDTNAGEVGSGNQGGTWDIDTNWTEDSSGLTTPTVGWVDGSAAIFSAGTDGTGAWEVTVDGTVVTPSILLEESGAKTISGGTISIGGGTITTAAAGNGNTVVISSVLTGSGGLTVNANGDLSDSGGGVGGRLELSGANDFIGDLTITGGLIRVDSGFGDATNKIILSGGGLLDSNINFDLTRNLEIPAGKTGFYRTYGGVATGQISGPITGSGTLIRTDGGTLTLSGDGSAFAGTIVNARGNLYLTSNDWSGTTLRLTEGTNRLYVTAPGDTSILSFNSDRDVVVPFGSRLNIIDGTYTTVGAGSTFNGFWAQGTSAGNPDATGEITSSSGTLTFTNGAATGDLTTNDNQLRLKITDFGSGDNPSLAFVKNNQNSLTLDQPNTYTGGTTLNGGRLNASNTSAFGTGTVTINEGAQAWLTQSGTYLNDFVINGSGPSEAAGNLGAIRFSGSTIAGDVNVASAANIEMMDTSSTISGALTGAGDLEVNFYTSGTLNLTGDASAYTGTLVMNAGVLNAGALGGGLQIYDGTVNLSGTVAGASSLFGGTLNLNNGAILDTPIVDGGTLSLNSGSSVTGGIVTSNISTINIAGSVTGNVELAIDDTLGLLGGSVTGNLVMTGDSSLTYTSPLSVDGDIDLQGAQMVNLNTIPDPTETITLLTYTGTATDSFDGDLMGNFSLNNGDAYRAANFTDTGSAITLTLGAESSSWVGADATNPTFWDTSSLNWSSTDQTFFNGDSLTFDDTATGTTIVMQSAVAPFSMVFDNTDTDYSVTGTADGFITGSTGITKNGTGALTLGGGAGQNYTGAVEVNAGVLRAATEYALGSSSSITVADGAQFDINGQYLGNGVRAYDLSIAGDGPDGLGALTNTSGTLVYSFAGIRNLTLTGDASFGGNGGRFDIGLSANVGSGAITGNGFTLTKVGSSGIPLRGDASGSPINIVVASGSIWGEDSDNSLGGATGTVTVQDGATLGSYGARSFVTPITLEQGSTLNNLGGGGSVWSDVTATGAANLSTGGNISFDGTLAGSGNITRSGGNSWFLHADASSYSGKIVNNGGTLRIENENSLGTATGPDVLTLSGTTLQGGTTAAQTSATIGSENQGITVTGNLNFGAGPNNTLTINSPVTGTGNLQKNNNAGDTVIFNQPVSSTLSNFTSLNGTTLLNQGLSLTWDEGLQAKLRSADGNSLTLGGTSSFRELEIATAAVNIVAGADVTFNQLEMSQGSGTQSVINHSGGTVNFTGTNNSNNTSASFLMGHWGGGSGSTYNLSGGVLNAQGAEMSLGWDSSNSNFNISGGTANFLGVDLGNGRNNTANFRLTGGRINLGSSGITNASNKIVSLGGGTVGAFSNWSSAKTLVLTGTNGDTIFDTLDSADGSTPRTITLTGGLTGVGGFAKQGAGALLISSSAADQFAGTAAVNEGSLFVNGTVANNAVVQVNAGGNLQAGNTSSAAAVDIAELELNGGNTTFRVGDSGDSIFTEFLTVSGESTISIVPTSALAVGQQFDLIEYLGDIEGLGSAGLTLNPIANPHYSAELDDTELGFIKLSVTGADTITWSGAAGSSWDVDTSANWLLDSDGTTATNFYEFDVVNFDDTGVETNITLTGDIRPASLSVDASQDYTFSGAGIAGNTGLTKTGTGTLNLLNNNSYLGAVTVSAGSVVVGDGGTSGSLGGSGQITVETDASFVMNRSDDQTLGRRIAGSINESIGTFVKNGAGILTMTSGNNSVDIVVNEGQINARGGGWSTSFAGNRTITVNSGATLDTTTHALGGLGGAVRPGSIVLNEDAEWFLNGEQQLPNTALVMDGAAVNGNGEMRGSGTISVIANDAKSSVITAPISSGNGAVTINVADGAVAEDLVVSGKFRGGNAFSKGGDGVLKYTGAANHSGNTNVNGGVLDLTSGQLYTGGYFGGAVVTVNSGGTIKINNLGYNENVGAAASLGGLRNQGNARVLNGGTFEVQGAGHNTGNNFNVTDNGGTFRYDPANDTNLLILSGNENSNIQVAGELTLDTVGDVTITEVLEGAGALVKTGTGTLTLDSNNTRSGATTLNAGTLAITGASLADGASLTINDGLVNINGTETVDSLYFGEELQLAGTYGSSESSAEFVDDTRFSGSGVLVVTNGATPPSGFGTWAETNAPGQSADQDFDGDGVPNGIEYVLGGTAETDDTDRLPSASIVDGDMVFTFLRDQASKTSDVAVSIEVGSDLATWPLSYVVGEDTAGSTTGVEVTDNLDGTDTVTLTVTMAPDAAKFGRLVVTVASPQ